MQPGLLLTMSQMPKTTDEWAQMRDTPYHEAVGSLMYAALGTCPDITFAIHALTRYSSKFGPTHWNAIKRVFSYLKGTKELWLTYGNTQTGLLGYADADRSTTEDRHAVSGYAFIVNGGAVSWSVKCQQIISLSMMESEYVAAAHAAKEALWLCSLIQQLFDEKLSPTTMFSDNQSAIALAKDHQYHVQTKHIDICYHLLCWIVEKGAVQLVYCPTEDMVVDTLTKVLPSAKVKHFAIELGISTV
jgi:hypothetical protein